MATVRENRRERYLTFDPERRSRFSNRWEIALVVLIISAGIVITTIAAIKARDAESEASDRSDKDYGSNVKKNKISSTRAPKRPPNHRHPSSVTTTTSAAPTTATATATASPRPSVRTTDAPIVRETQTDSVTIQGQFDDSLHNFFAPDYSADDYEIIQGKPSQPSDVVDRDQSASEQQDKKIIQILDQDENVPADMGVHQDQMPRGQSRNHQTTMIEDHDGLPGFPAPSGFVIPLESEGQNVELTADGAGFVMDDGRGEIESRMRHPYENDSKQLSIQQHHPHEPKLLERPHHDHQHQVHDAFPSKDYSGVQDFDQQQDVRVITGPAEVPMIASNTDLTQHQPVMHVPVTSDPHQSHHQRKKHHHRHPNHSVQQIQQQQVQTQSSGLRPQQSNVMPHVIQAVNPPQHPSAINPVHPHTVIVHPNQHPIQQQVSQHVQPVMNHAPHMTITDAQQQQQQQHAIPVFVDQNSHAMQQNVNRPGNIPMGMPLAGILMQQQGGEVKHQSFAQRLAEKMLQHTLPSRASHQQHQPHQFPILNFVKRSKRDVKSLPMESNFIQEDNKVVDNEAAASRFYSMDDFDPPHQAALHHPGPMPHPLFVDSFNPVTHSSGDFGSSSNNRRRSSGGGRRLREGRGSGRRLSQEAESHHKKTFGILGSGNFEVIRGGIYREDSDNGSEGGRPHHGGHSDKGVHEDYDDASTGHSKYAFAPTGATDDDTSLFNTRDPVLGFQGFDNFHLASNQEEDLKKMDASRHRPIFVDLDQDLLATA